jgi:hypothetical protein
MTNRPSYEESVKEIESGFMVGSPTSKKGALSRLFLQAYLQGIASASLALVWSRLQSSMDPKIVPLMFEHRSKVDPFKGDPDAS